MIWYIWPGVKYFSEGLSKSCGIFGMNYQLKKKKPYGEGKYKLQKSKWLCKKQSENGSADIYSGYKYYKSLEFWLESKTVLL